MQWDREMTIEDKQEKAGKESAVINESNAEEAGGKSEVLTAEKV